MRNPFVHLVGGVLSADIAVPDHDRELQFYSSILTTGDSPLWRDDLMNNVGTPVIGLGIRTPEYAALPLQWMPHFQVADVATSVDTAIELGGKELWHSKAEDGESQWAVLSDPTGAAFGIIPVVPTESDSITGNERVGCISWLSLNVPAPSQSQEFYRHVIGWNAKSIETPDSDGNCVRFEMMINDDTAAAEICQQCDGLESIPSVWLMHLLVGHFEESLKRVRERGGEVIHRNTTSQSAVIKDPVGVYLALQASH